MKRVILVHGWEGSPEGDWFPWVIKELQERGYKVEALRMPNPDVPKIEEWVSYLKKEVGEYDENTIFIGHSIGCQTILRYLEKEERRAGGAILVAGWFNIINLEDEEAETIANPWIETPIDLEKVKNNLGFIKVILGDKDEWVPYGETKKDFEERLGAEVITIPNGGHITSDDGFGEFSQLIEAII